jgi:hypothetical protein
VAEPRHERGLIDTSVVIELGQIDAGKSLGSPRLISRQPVDLELTVVVFQPGNASGY